MADYIMLLPFECALLWAIGGREGGRYFRRIGVGLTVGFNCYLQTRDLLAFICIFTYWIVCSIGYGKLIAKRMWHVLFIVGFFYGVASAPVSAITGKFLLFQQGLVAACIFTGLTYWSNTGKHKLHWALAEGGTGFAATILVPFMILA